MILPVLRASESLNALLMEEFGEGRQGRRGRARLGWMQTEPPRGAVTWPGPSFPPAPVWPPGIELSRVQRRHQGDPSFPGSAGPVAGVTCTLSSRLVSRSSLSLNSAAIWSHFSLCSRT